MSARVDANLAGQLVKRAREHPERLAIVEPGGRALTFGALAGRVARLAAALGGAGVRPGDQVLLFVPMSAELYVALLACLHVGAVAVFVDAWADRARLDRAVRAAEPRLMIGTPRAQLLRVRSPAVRAIPRHWIAGRRALSLARYERAEPVPVTPVAGAQAALVTFTTGSTGAPKAAARSHDFLWAQHRVLVRHLGTRPGDVDLPTLPVFVLSNLAAGATSVLADLDPRRPAEFDPEAVHRQILAHGVETTSGSPAFYARLAAWCAERGIVLPLRSLHTGGAPVYPPLARALEQSVAGAAHVVYGSTEAEPIAAVSAAGMLRAMESAAAARGLYAGRPVPEVEVKIVRAEDGAIALGAAGWAEWEVAAGEVGEVVLTGEHVLRGYLNAPEAERLAKIPDGERVWHRTGDAAWRDAEGGLWLMGRVAERVRRAGGVGWGAPAERAALGVPGIRHAAYLGVADPALGERAVLCVETADGRLAPVVEAALRNALDALPADEIVAMRHIPRDPRHASKTDMVRLRELLRTQPESRWGG